MRVVFYARPWSTRLLAAVEDHWRDSGLSVECRYIAHQAQAVQDLRRLRRDAVMLNEAIERMPVTDPVAELQRIEARYGDSLLPLPRYAMAERFFAGRDRDWQRDQLARYAVFFERMFEDFQPDLFVGESADIMPAWLGYHMARWHGCESVGLLPSTLPPGRLLMLRGHEEIPGARETYEQLRAEPLPEDAVATARSLQAVVRGEGTRLDYVPPDRSKLDFARRLATGEILGHHIKGSIWQIRERLARNWFLQPDPLLMRLRQPWHAVRAALADRRYLNDSLSGRPFVFYPLHFEPEATTLVHGSYFESQLGVVRNLARSLPAGWDLVVKEHFWMRGQRRLADYRAYRSIPNVRLAPFDEPTNSLIMSARVVAVIASTVGLEASLIGKPVLMFGRYPWDYAPTVQHVGALEELPRQIRLLAEQELGPDHPDVLAFAASWERSLPPGRYYRTRAYDWTDRENVGNLADALANRAGRAPEPTEPTTALS